MVELVHCLCYVIALFILFILISLCIPILAVVLNFWCWLFENTLDVVENFSVKKFLTWHKMHDN